METPELFSEINYIRNKVDSLERLTFLQVKSNKQLYDLYVKEFIKDQTLYNVYLEIDGKKTQKEIASQLHLSNASISNKITKLYELELIVPKNRDKNGTVSCHSHIENLFKFTKGLKKNND